MDKIILTYRSKLKTNYTFKMPRKTLMHNGTLWLSSFDDNCIFLFDPETEMLKGTVSFPNLHNPRGMFPKGKYIYIACYGDPMGKVICLDSETLKEIFYFEVPRPRGLVILENEIFVTEVMEHRVSVFDLNGNLMRYIGTGILQCPRGIAIDNSGNIVIADSANNRVVWFNPDGRFLNSSDGLLSPNDVVCYNNNIFVSEWFGKCIKIFNASTGKFGKSYTVPYESGFLSMFSISDDRLFISDDSGCVHVFNVNNSMLII